jgi:hypothetical protein
MIDLASMSGVFGGGLALGVVMACWGHIKGMLERALGLLVIRVEVVGYAAQAIGRLCWHEFQSSHGAFRKFTGTVMHVRPLDRKQAVGFEQFPEKAALFWDGWRPIVVSAPLDKDHGHLRTTVTFIRGTFQVEALLERAFKALNQYMQGTHLNDHYYEGAGKRFAIRRCVGSGGRKMISDRDDDDGPRLRSPSSMGLDDVMENRPLTWKPEELGPQVSVSEPFSYLALPPAMEVAIEEARRWIDSKKWYADRQIPWRRGWLLHGKPGTGKTSCVKALAQELDLPVYIMDIASMSNKEFINAWTTALAQSPAVVLIEDIDAVFEGRENLLGESGGGLTFDCLLNAISGVESAEGIFTIITTNHIETVDPALASKTQDGSMSSRPGRIDRVIELGALSRDGRYKIARRILECCPDLVEDCVAAGDGDTGAQFQERCSSLALQQYWTGRDAAGGPDSAP